MKRGFTLIEVLVVLAIVAILAGIIFAAVSRTRISAEDAACGQNLRQVGLAVKLYSEAHDGLLPPIVNGETLDTLRAGRRRWGEPFDSVLLRSPLLPEALAGYIDEPGVLQCKTDIGIGGNPPRKVLYGSSFLYDELGPLIVRRLDSYPYPSESTLLLDTGVVPEDLKIAHRRMVNCLRADLSLQRVQNHWCLEQMTPPPLHRLLSENR